MVDPRQALDCGEAPGAKGATALVPASTGAAVVPASQPESSLMATVEQTLARLDEFTDLGYLTDLHNQARGFSECLLYASL